MDKEGLVKERNDLKDQVIHMKQELESQAAANDSKIAAASGDAGRMQDLLKKDREDMVSIRELEDQVNAMKTQRTEL